MFFRKNLKNFFIVFVLLAVIFVGLRGVDSPAKGLVMGISSPFLKTFRIFSGGLSGFFDFLGSIGNLKKENENVSEENRKLVAEINRLKDMDKENQALRKELELAPKAKFDLEASFVVAQDPQGMGNYFIIDKGESSDIREGMPAVVSGGILVGKVSETYPNQAKVLLVTDPESSINAEAQESGAKGILQGKYGLGLKMGTIAQTEVINDGDTVITSGLGGSIPRGLTIGKISQVQPSADKLFQEASVAPAVELSRLRMIFIVKKF